MGQAIHFYIGSRSWHRPEGITLSAVEWVFLSGKYRAVGRVEGDDHAYSDSGVCAFTPWL